MISLILVKEESALIFMRIRKVLDEFMLGDRYFVPEIVKGMKHNKKGVVSFSTTWDKNGLPNAGTRNVTLGSQFMITLSDSKLDYLDGKHAIFGQVVEGLDVLDKLNAVLVDSQSKPYQDIRILHTVILDDPFPDLPGFVEPQSPPPPERVLKAIRAEKERESERGMTEEELARYPVILYLVVLSRKKLEREL